jgi:modulator of FtsH protease HflC
MSLLHLRSHSHGQSHSHPGEHASALRNDHGEVASMRSPLYGLRYVIAAVIVVGLVLSACLVLIGPGDAIVITRFGNPVQVITQPGLAWRLPAPVEDIITVDLRLRTTSSGLQDVGTRDGLRVLMQAYVAWQVPRDPASVRQFLRAVQDQPDNAAEQLRSFVASALEVTASGFTLSDLVNTDPAKVQIARFEQALRQRLQEQVLRTYGIAIRQVGLERLTLPPETLDATVARMRADRLAVATARMAEGERQAAQIRSDADRDSRIAVANAEAQAAAIKAKAEVQAASIYGKAYQGDPALYTTLRSLDTLDQVVSGNTRLILRTDAAPFRVLVNGPDAPGPNESGPTKAAP